MLKELNETKNMCVRLHYNTSFILIPNPQRQLFTWPLM